MEGGKGRSEVKQVPPQPDEFWLSSIPNHLLLGVATSGRGEFFEEELWVGREGRVEGRSEVKQVPSQPNEFWLSAIPHHLLLGVATGGRGVFFEEDLLLRREGRKGEGGRKYECESIIFARV